MSRMDGRRPHASVHRITAGCLPSAGWNQAALQVPSGVLIVTSFSTTGGPAGIAAAGSDVAATPVATDSATNSRRRRSPASGKGDVLLVLLFVLRAHWGAPREGSAGWPSRWTRISRQGGIRAVTRASYPDG